MRRWFSAGFVLMLAVACAGEQSPVAQVAATSERATPEQEQGGVPDDLVKVLRADGTSVEGAGFDSGLSAEETLRRFDKEYAPRFRSGGTPAVYAVKVAASSSTLESGAVVRMVYVPDVPQAFEGVAPPPGASESSWEPPPAHMFAFFDANTGRHIETTYIAMSE